MTKLQWFTGLLYSKRSIGQVQAMFSTVSLLAVTDTNILCIEHKISGYRMDQLKIYVFLDTL